MEGNRQGWFNQGHCFKLIHTSAAKSILIQIIVLKCINVAINIVVSGLLSLLDVKRAQKMSRISRVIAITVEPYKPTFTNGEQICKLKQNGNLCQFAMILYDESMLCQLSL